MATPIVDDPTPAINPSFLAQPDFSRMQANDQLGESLLKARALAFIFSCSDLGNYDENLLQWYASAMLDAIQSAKDALDFLQVNTKGFL